jgi:alginate O-acetyltransferase complex protein AlgI
MVFSSVNFIFAFLPLLFVCYFIVPKKFRKLRNFILLAFSLIFYAYGEPRYVLVMLASILINYAFGMLLHWQKGWRKKTVRKRLVGLAVLINIGILVYFKYTMFLVENLNAMFQQHWAIPNIVMPIGISFFTFQGLSYVFDLYYHKAEVEKNPLNVALYISLFPQLIAGPIVRYETVATEIRQRRENRSDMASGIQRFAIGLGKKMLIANQMGLVADQIFSISPGDLTTATAWIGALAYTFQIYFDFSGYSDMAIGLGRIFGFHFLENFNYPYISRSITEFWRRWHISLSSWFRDYVYIPLGGNRKGVAKHIRNIFLVWLLTGIWHGAAWTFVCWGLYYFVLLMLEKYGLKKWLKGWVGWVYTMVLVTIGWVIFRADTISYAGRFIGAMFGIGSAGGWNTESLFLLAQYRVEWVLAILCALPLVKWVRKGEETKAASLVPIAKLVFAAGVFALSVLYLVNSSFNPFIYFRF